MGKSQSIYMWENVDMIIQRIESQIYSNSKSTYLYDPKYCSKDNEYCSIKSYHII